MSKPEERLKFTERALAEIQRQHAIYEKPADMPLPEQLRHIAALFDAYDGGVSEIFEQAQELGVDDDLQQVLRQAADLLEKK
jgi:hypothetical protein